MRVLNMNSDNPEILNLEGIKIITNSGDSIKLNLKEVKLLIDGFYTILSKENKLQILLDNISFNIDLDEEFDFNHELNMLKTKEIQDF